MKIVVIGSLQSGKSSYIKYLDKKAMNIETQGRDKKFYTVGMDLASIKIDGFDVFLFGTPGLLRMEVMRDVLVNGADAVIFLIDSTDPTHDAEGLKILTSVQKILKPSLPLIYCANKQDEENSRSVKEIVSVYNIPKSSKLFKINTRTGTNVMESLKYIVNTIFNTYKDVLKLVRKHQDNLDDLASVLKMNPSELNDFLYNLEVKRFIEIDREKKVVRLKPTIPL
ncbi:MAG: GTP-binding protein [Candidatus Lokiarchaeota archaeon]|nr:GTP-binding protein [Candidatus Lokiarchaeota archaeon]